MSSNGQADAAVPSELNVMLDLYSDEEDRNAIRKAYHDLAHGDPKTFPVQFAASKCPRASAEGLSTARPGHPKGSSRRVAIDCRGRHTN
jgi:hypothetical protein